MKVWWAIAGLFLLVYFLGPVILRAMAKKDLGGLQQNLSTAHEIYYQRKLQVKPEREDD